MPKRKNQCPDLPTPGKEPPGVGTRMPEWSVASRCINHQAPRKKPRGAWARMPIGTKDNSLSAVACHPYTSPNSRRGERVTIHTRNRPGYNQDENANSRILALIAPWPALFRKQSKRQSEAAKHRGVPPRWRLRQASPTLSSSTSNRKEQETSRRNFLNKPTTLRRLGECRRPN
jgi:hypothetical protein